MPLATRALTAIPPVPGVAITCHVAVWFWAAQEAQWQGLTQSKTPLATLQRIVAMHYPGVQKRLVAEALNVFFEIRDVPGMRKKPSTAELLDWIKLLMVEDIPPEALRSADKKDLIPPLYGALIKNEQDVHLLERLAFLHRREGG